MQKCVVIIFDYIIDYTSGILQIVNILIICVMIDYIFEYMSGTSILLIT